MYMLITQRTIYICVHHVRFISEREYRLLNDFLKSSLLLRTFSFFAPRVIAYKNHNVIQAANDLDPLFSSSGYARQANHLSLAFSGQRWINPPFFFPLSFSSLSVCFASARQMNVSFTSAFPQPN